MFPGDDQIELAVNVQELISVAKGDQYYLAVWTDIRTVNEILTVFGSGPYFEEQMGNTRDIYAVRYDLSGNLVDQEPIVVSNATYSQTRPRVAWNGENFLVTWVGEREAYFYEDVYAARVSQQGVVLDDPAITVWQDVVSVWPNVTSDGNNWFVAWIDWFPVDRGIIGARIGPDGTVLDPVPVDIRLEGANLWTSFDFTWAVDEYLVVWQEDGWVKGQRFASDLTPIDPIAFNVNPQGFRNTSAPRVATDGTDFFVVWNEDRTSVISRVFGSRVTHGGQVLDPEGITIQGAVEYNEFEPAVEWDGTNWWVAYNDDAGSRYDMDMVVKRISPAGVILDPVGIVVRSTPEYQQQADIQPATGGGAHVFWREQTRSAGPYDVMKADVAADGTVSPAEGVGVGLPRQQQTRFASHDGVHMAVYLSEVSMESRVLAQRFDDEGNAIDLEPIVVGLGEESRVGTPGMGAPGVAWNHSLYLVVWSNLNVIYGRRIAEDGTLIDPAPFVIMTQNDQADVAALAGNFLVVGSHEYSGDFRTIQGARVRGSDGTVLDPSPLWIGGNYDLIPRAAAFGNRWLVVWETQISHNDDYSQIKANFVDQGGSMSGVFYVNPNGVGDDPKIAVNGDEALVVYSDRTVPYDVQLDGQIIGTNGQWIGPEIAISDDLEDQHFPGVAWDGRQYLVAWVDYRDVAYLDQPRGDIYISRVTEDGTVKDPDGVQISSGPLGEEYPEIAAQGGKFLLSYSKITGLTSDETYRVGARVVEEDLPGLLLAAPSPGRAGELNTFTVSGATPGEKVHFVYGFQNGSTDVPGCPGVTVDITNPMIAGGVVADVNGIAMFEITVPGGASGRTVWIQSVELGTCQVSNMNGHTFP